MPILSNREYDILLAFAETLMGQGVAESGVTEKIGDHLRYFSKDVRLAFRALLFAFDYGACLYKLRLKTFRGMDQKWRSRYLGAWRSSSWAPRRALWRFLNAVVYMNYYSIPKVAAAVGYSPVFKKPKVVTNFLHENMFISPFDHDVKEECDVCIIGSGAGGAVAAKVLAEAGKKVVILEEGGHFSVEDFGQDPVSMTKLLYRNGGLTNTFGWPAILVPLGRCVGGTTTINSGTCFRTPFNVLERWVGEFGLSTWTPSRLEKYYDDVEKTLQIEPANILKKNVEVFKRGLERLGFEGYPINRNAPGCRGSGVCNLGCPTNAKQSTNISYIPMALKAGAKLYTYCQASRFLYNDTHANTVIARFRHPQTFERLATMEVKARVIILACGSLHTPVLLMRSHVPNPSGMIGHNLSLHPAAKVAALFDEEIRGFEGIPQGYYMDALAGEGIKLEEIFLSPSYFAPTLLHVGLKHREVMEGYRNLAIFGMMVSDTSRGRIVRLPNGRPLTIYNINKEDLPKYIKGLELLAKVFFAAGAKRVFLPIHTLPELSCEEGTASIYKNKIHRKDLELLAFHPLGTCRMGADPRSSVCDQYGRFYGMDNVFIADGSIFPSSLGVNPMLTIMAAASKIAEYIDREVL